MLKTQIDSLDVEKLLHSARALSDGQYEIPLGTSLAESGVRNGTEFSLSSEQIAEFLGASHEEFVDQAYREILGRPADEEAHFCAKLDSGDYTPMEVLAFLRFSPEGRSTACELPSEKWFLALALSTRLPVGGPRRWLNQRLLSRFVQPPEPSE